MSSFYFALTNVEAEPLLKEEIRLRYPELKLSYSRPGFLTFKGDKKILFRPVFARVSGESLGKVKLAELNPEKAWVWKRSEDYDIPPKLKEVSERSLFKVGESVTLIMMVGPEEFWVGEYQLLKTHFQTPGEVSSIEQVKAPSRAYYKLAEAFEAFDLPFDHNERVLELGSAPGGSSLFLLEQDMKVLGVDPAEMDPEILKHFNFKHLKRPFETITKENFREDVDWIISDVNLPPTVVIKEVERFLDFLEPRGLVITLKINQPKYVRLLPEFRDRIKDRGFDKVALKYFPSHRQEIALVAMRDESKLG